MTAKCVTFAATPAQRPAKERGFVMKAKKVIARTDPNEQERVVLLPEMDNLHFS